MTQSSAPAEFVARYRVESPEHLEAVAEIIAGEQSSGSFLALAGETEDLKRRARVLRVTRLADAPHPTLPSAVMARRGRTGGCHRGEVEIAFPVDNVGPNLSTLLATICGNLYELGEVTGLRLLDIDLPASYATQFPGPQFGIAGTRDKAGVHGRPIIGTIIKPSIGLTPEVLPIDDREWDRAAERIRRLSRAKHVFFPGSARIDRLAVPDITARSFVIRVYLEKQGPLQGVLLAWGSRFGGFTFYVQDAQVVLRYVFSQDLSHEVRVAETVPQGRPASILAIFERQDDGSTVVRIEGTGITPASMRVPRTWPVTGTPAGLSCGADHGHPVCDDYASPFHFAGGTLGRVEIEVSPGAVTAAWDPEDAIAYED